MPDSVHTQNTALVAIDFHGKQLFAFTHQGEEFVAMRPAVEAIGLSWGGQRDKLVSDPKFNCTAIRTVGADGKGREMMALPLHQFGGWLYSINANRIADEDRRALVLLCQRELTGVIHAHLTKGVAVRGDMDGLVTNLDPSVMRALGGMVKGILQKQLGELLPSLVNEQLLTGDRKVVQGVSALEVADMAGYGRGNRPRGLSQFITRKLWAYHIARKHFPERSPHGAGKVWVYNESLVRRWLMEGGQIEIDHYAAKRKGQGSLRLVQV